MTDMDKSAKDPARSEAKKLKSQLSDHYKALKDQFSKAESTLKSIGDIYTKLLSLEETSKNEQAISQLAAAQKLLPSEGPRGSRRHGDPKDYDFVRHIGGSPACGKPEGKPGVEQVDSTHEKPATNVTAYTMFGNGENFVSAASVTLSDENSLASEGLTKEPHAFVKAFDSSVFEFDNPSPHMIIEVLEGNAKFQCQALPDTGCTYTLLGLDHVKDNNIQMYPASIKLFAADGEELPIKGAVTIRIKHEGLEIETEALVSSALNKEAVISWQDLQSLEVISKDFPHRDPTLMDHSGQQMDHSGQPRRAPAIQTGTHVVIRNTATMRWDIAGTVQAVHVNGPCLLVRLEDRRTFIFRNRDHIRPTGIE